MQYYICVIISICTMNLPFVSYYCVYDLCINIILTFLRCKSKPLGHNKIMFLNITYTIIIHSYIDSVFEWPPDIIKHVFYNLPYFRNHIITSHCLALLCSPGYIPMYSCIRVYVYSCLRVIESSLYAMY